MNLAFADELLVRGHLVQYVLGLDEDTLKAGVLRLTEQQVNLEFL